MIVEWLQSITLLRLLIYSGVFFVVMMAFFLYLTHLMEKYSNNARDAMIKAVAFCVVLVILTVFVIFLEVTNYEAFTSLSLG